MKIRAQNGKTFYINYTTKTEPLNNQIQPKPKLIAVRHFKIIISI